jgi:hypothetical protein
LHKSFEAGLQRVADRNHHLGREETAALAPWARVVKAIPPFTELLHSDHMESRAKGQVSFYVATIRRPATSSQY